MSGAWFPGEGSTASAGRGVMNLLIPFVYAIIK